jgi:hypothetical protein
MEMGGETSGGGALLHNVAPKICQAFWDTLPYRQYDLQWTRALSGTEHA